jgi:hypothetical protein
MFGLSYLSAQLVLGIDYASRYKYAFPLHVPPDAVILSIIAFPAPVSESN